MIIHKEKVEIMGDVKVRKEVTFSIAPAAMKHVMHMLSNMYSDPYRAIAREYIANAADAHRIARMRNPGVVLPAIMVHIPSRLDPTFKVRDFGPGMTVDETAELLSNFGASGEEKRTSDSIIGGFGIGSKCGFAVSDTFSFTVFRDGRKRVWICTTRDDAARALQMVSDIPTDEPDGVEVSVPIKHGAEERVRDGVRYVMNCLNEPIDLGNGPQKREWTDLKVGSATLSTPDTALENVDLDKCLCSYIMHGDFIYPLDPVASGAGEMEEWDRFVALSKRLDGDNFIKDGTLGKISGGHCFMKFPAGTFRLSPSRESIIWDDAAKNCLQSAIRVVVAVVIREVSTLEEKAETPLDFLRIRKLHVSKGLHGGPRYRHNQIYCTIPPVYRGVTYTSENVPYIDVSASDENGPKKNRVFMARYDRVGRRGNYRTMLKFSNQKGYPYILTLLDDLSNLWRCLCLDTKFYISEKHSTNKLFTLGRFKYILTEPMKYTDLEESITATYPETAYHANGSREILVIVGDEAFRNAKLVELAGWLDAAITDKVLTPPPKPVRVKSADGSDTDNSGQPVTRKREDWMKIDHTGAASPVTVDPGATVVNLGGVFSRDNAVLAHRFIQLAKMFVPELKNAELYSLTVDQLKRHNREPQCKVVYNWHEKFYEWINTYAQAEMDKPGLGFEVLVCSGFHFGDWMVPKESGDDSRPDLYLRNVFGSGGGVSVNADAMLRMYDLLKTTVYFKKAGRPTKSTADNSPIERFIYQLDLRRAYLRNSEGGYGERSIFRNLFEWMRIGKHNPYGMSSLLSDESRQTVLKNALKLIHIMEDVVFDDVNTAFFIDVTVERSKYDCRRLNEDLANEFYQRMKQKKFPPTDRVVKNNDSE